MNNTLPVNYSTEAMSDKNFLRFSEFIHEEYGIKMPSSKRTMLQARLQKRLLKLGMGSFTEYCDYVFSPVGVREELSHMVDVVTTNKTDFFREPAHFDYMTQTVLPQLVNANGSGIRRRLSVWSSGCSTGEEPYTLAMVLREFVEECPGFHFSIIATDISNIVLEKASLGIYERDKVDPVPIDLKRKYLLRSKKRDEDLVRIVPELRGLVQFRRLNLMDHDFNMRNPKDIIFCRNVIIYFDQPTQKRLVNQLCRYLRPGGYLFLGHSETLNGLDAPLTPVAPTVYRKLK